MAEWIAEAGSCGYDHIGELPHRIYANPRGRGPVHVWESYGKIIGLDICLRFGAAFDVFTSPELRGSATERDIIEAAAATTARHSTAEYVLTDVWDCDAIRVKQLERLGFEHFRTWDHVNERDLDTVPVTPHQPRPARLADAAQLAEARNAAFGEDWTATTYRQGVMEKPGYAPEREIVVEAPDGRIAAFAVYWMDSHNKIGHFEPVGTHPDFQRQGFGRAVLAYAMGCLKDLGARTVTVSHDAENLPAARLYASSGFARTHETWGFRRRAPVRAPGEPAARKEPADPGAAAGPATSAGAGGDGG
jgi:ribosomal protein S18 acetylase RimI-like enzyme